MKAIIIRKLNTLTPECTFEQVQACVNEINILYQNNGCISKQLVEGDVTITIPNLLESLNNIFSYKRNITGGDMLAVSIIKELIHLC